MVGVGKKRCGWLFQGSLQPRCPTVTVACTHNRRHLVGNQKFFPLRSRVLAPWLLTCHGKFHLPPASLIGTGADSPEIERSNITYLCYESEVVEPPYTMNTCDAGKIPLRRVPGVCLELVTPFPAYRLSWPIKVKRC